MDNSKVYRMADGEWVEVDWTTGATEVLKEKEENGTFQKPKGSASSPSPEEV